MVALPRIGLSVCAVVALAAAVAPWRIEFRHGAGDGPVVAGYEVLRTSGTLDEAVRGELLLSELNCVACHPAGKSGTLLAPRTAPDLNDVGTRVRADWITSYILAPQATQPGTTMPAPLAALPAGERSAAARHLTHYLIARSGRFEPPPFRTFRFRRSRARGRALYHTVGCVACHAPDSAEARPAIRSVPFPDLAEKTSVAALAEFLLDPAATRPAGRMPSLYLSADEATDIAVYLLREQAPAPAPVQAGFEFEYFLDPMQDEDAEGFWARPPPDFDQLVVAGRGRVRRLTFDLPIETSWGNHMFRFAGLLRVDQPGLHTFVLRSDASSGSELLIDGQPVATKERTSGREITARIELEAGDRAVEVTYYIRGDTPEPFLDVSVESAALEGPVPLEDLVVYEDVYLVAGGPESFRVDPELAAAGETLFAKTGCAGCHQQPPKPADVPRAAPLSDLDARADNWHRVAGPSYALADHQRSAIRRALDARGARTPTVAEQAALHLATYNCYGCHARADELGRAGGPGDYRRAYFRAVPGQDVGDEGRVPPALSGVGGKLRPEALASILMEERLHVRRHFMQTRMPRFGGEPLTALPGLLATLDQQPDDLDEPPFSLHAVADGRELVGNRGMRCITCHDVGIHRAQGVSAINMTRFYDRLRPGWFSRWLRDPQKIRPGTRMPDFWAGGTIIHPDIAGGTVRGQIDAIFSYISLGASMPVPEGMQPDDFMVLQPDTEPLILRTFMVGVGPRAIVVGYPESVHIAFDANVIRLAQAWRGGFYDAQGMWSGRGGRFLTPAGDDILNLPPGPALAFLGSATDAWPPVSMTDRNIGGAFRGYRLGPDGRPAFMYEVGTVSVEESYIPEVGPGGTGLIRRFAIDAGSQPASGLFVLIGEGAHIEETDRGEWSVDGDLRVTLPHHLATRARVRNSQGVQQLILPIELAAGQSVSLDIGLAW